MVTDATTRLIEEISINAWPSSQTLVYDGWVIRFAGGYTRRANSVNPLYGSARDVEAKIEYCESVFRDKDLPTVFKMTAASEPSGLDERLAARGYKADAYTGLRLLDLRYWQGEFDPEITLSQTMPAEWFAGYWQMGTNDSRHENFARQILGNIVPATCYASLQRDGKIVAVGLGVFQDGYVGLYDIVTAPEYRQQGFGRRIVQTLLAWGKQQGAYTSYLQVMLNNPPALALYDQIGYRECYQYWYRVKQVV